ncbi:MAG: lipoate--protein ligase family protein [Cyanobacteriota bacterium]|nr:lipoate--protein ligase family protein [Cyanobacteriota bacterium]
MSTSTARWIPPLVLGGAWQMAIDGWLHERGQAMLRVYRWSRPTLSLGAHQQRLPAHWWALQEQGLIELVRRPSGGRAVLHSGDLTYALVWPDPPGRRLEAYAEACRWLQAAFAELGQPLQLGREPARGAAGGRRGGNCFASGTAADLVHPDGSKRIGSAQYWRRGVLLQHGSIQLAPDRRLWRDLFGDDPPPLAPLPLAGQDLEDLLRRCASQHLAPLADLRERDLDAGELAAIAGRLDAQRPSPVDGETSPDRTMPRTTDSRASPSG